MSAKYIWLFVDGESQETFRIRTGDPVWQTSDNGSFEQARCSFNIVAEDGTGFKFQLRVTGGVLESQGVNDADGLIKLLVSIGADIIEGVINRGVRGDQQILWESDGVAVG